MVPDYNAAIDYYVSVLGFQLLEDTKLDRHKRWVVVSAGDSGARLLLAKAATEQQKAAIGNQAGGRVFLFLESDNFDHDYQKLCNNGVQFSEEPRDEEYGKVAVFVDRFGNQWDLIQMK